MNFTENVVMTKNQVIRARRGAREDACDSIGYGTSIIETVADLAGDINSIPIIGDAAGIITGSIAAVSHETKSGMDITKTALACDDIPFEEIKEIMDNKFNELGRKLDDNAQALAKVSEMVGKTSNIVEKIRIELNKGFENLVESIDNNEVRAKVTQINNFVEYFEQEKKRIRVLPKDDYVAKLEEEDSFLDHLKRSRTPTGYTLLSAILDIIRNNFAIPNDANDKKAFQALYALFYGTQTYVSTFGFLMEGHSYLADYNYQKGNDEKFNEQFDIMKTVYDEFKEALIGNNGLITKVSGVLNTVKSKGFIKSVNDKIYKDVSDRAQVMDTLKQQVQGMLLPIIRDSPQRVTVEFKKPYRNTPIAGWRQGSTVRYAVQIESSGLYSKIGTWSDPITITNKAFPQVKTPVDKFGRNRLIFRKFDDEEPQLVAVLTKSKTEFRDINRDLYNAAKNPDKEEGLTETKKLIDYGADVNSIFDLGRSVLHAAAEAGNVKVMKYLLSKNFRDINIKDKRGYTPIHVAAEKGRRIFIEIFVEKGGDVNARTNGDLYTPLHLAVKNNYIQNVDELLHKRDCDANLKDKNGFMPLHGAMLTDSELVRKFHMKRVLDVNGKSKLGLAPLHVAALRGDPSIFMALKDTNTMDANIVDINNMTPLHYAAMLGHIDIIKKLLAINGIKMNTQAKGNKWTALHYAIFLKKVDAAKELINKQGTDINKLADGDISPLHLAVSTGQKAIVDELLKKNANVEVKSKQGFTALHLAAMRNNKGIAEALVNKGANIGTKTKDNKTALELATQYSSNDVKGYLQSKSGRRFRRSIESTYSPITSLVKGKLLYGIFSKAEDLNALKLLENSNSFKQTKVASIQNFDSNGTLLLLDVLLRKLTNEKYGSSFEGTIPELEIKAAALNIADEFEKMLSDLGDFHPEEHIDLSEVYSRIKKALESQNGGKIGDILCSYAEKILYLNPENKVKVMKKLSLMYPTLENKDHLVGDMPTLLMENCSF